jgi:hypothetical protein
VAREIAYPLGQVLALEGLTFAAQYADDLDGAVRLARQARQVTAGIPGSIARWCSFVLAAALMDAGDLAAAEAVGAAALAQARDTGDLYNEATLLSRAVILDLEAGRFLDGAAHLRETIQFDMRTATWGGFSNALDYCGLLCAATGRPAEAVTVWAAHAAHLGHQDDEDTPAEVRRREGPLRRARQALGPGRTRAAEQRGTAMSTQTAVEYALVLTDPSRRSGRCPDRGRSAPGNGNWSPWSPAAAPTRRSPASCTSASGLSARTWTGSGTRPAAAAAPT